MRTTSNTATLKETVLWDIGLSEDENVGEMTIRLYRDHGPELLI